jgi:hypothetical protein
MKEGKGKTGVIDISYRKSELIKTRGGRKFEDLSCSQ